MVEAIYRRGDAGPAVAEIRELLIRIGLLEEPDTASPAPAAYDEPLEVAVRTFQQERGLTVDGIVGPLTFRRLDEARWRLGDRILTHLPGDLMAGEDVYALQRRLLGLGFRVGRVDGYFGPETAGAVQDFQRNVGIPPDGTCGPATLKALARLRPIVEGGAPNALRVEERIRDAGPHLGGKIVVLDVGHDDNFPTEHVERAGEILHDLAARIEGRLVAIGVQAYLTTLAGRPLVAERDSAAFANRTGADLFCSLALDSAANPSVSGCSTYFFGDSEHRAWSSAGERFAGLVQREIVARTDLVDLRWHPKTWEVLRRTRMPAIRLTPGYLSNAHDAEQLADPRFRDVLAEAVVVGVQRFYLTPDVDAHTGVLQASDLRDSFSSRTDPG